MNFRTITQLPQIDVNNPLHDNDMFEVSRALTSDGNGITRYQSFCISKSVFANDIRDSAISTIVDTNHPFGRDWNKIKTTVFGMANDGGEIALSGNINFVHTPTTNESPLDSFDEDYDNKLVDLHSLKNFSFANSPLFMANGNSYFTTEYFNVENNLTLSNNNAPSVNGEKHNEYLFRINNTTSNIWKTTDSGIFTCYGWIDQETQGTPDNSNKWVALEGRLSNGGNEWNILQLQPFVPNLYCSYVGFTFPVGKGLELRIRTGFRVGTNSNKYQSYQGSLTNHIANAFIGGIYRADSLERSNENRRSLSRSFDGKPIEKATGTTIKALRDELNAVIDRLNNH